MRGDVSRAVTSGVDKWLTTDPTLRRTCGVNRIRDITRLIASLIYCHKSACRRFIWRALSCLSHLKMFISQSETKQIQLSWKNKSFSLNLT